MFYLDTQILFCLEQIWAGYFIGGSLFQMIKVVAASTSLILYTCYIFRFNESRPLELVSFSY
jgi:hypothetical protein